MLIEQYVLNDRDELEFSEQTLCCYNEEKGAMIENGCLIVFPLVKRIKCQLKGLLNSFYLGENHEKVHEINEYHTIVFTSKLDFNINCLKDSGVNKLFFLMDVESIKGDPSFLRNKEIKIRLGSDILETYLKKKGLPFRYL